MKKDIVCGMDMEEKKAFQTIFRHERYYFCCFTCKIRFEHAPEEYLLGRAQVIMQPAVIKGGVHV